jgi:hypothetical protein
MAASAHLFRGRRLGFSEGARDFVVGGGARREDGQELRVVRLKVHAGLLQPKTPKKTKTRATHRDKVQSRDGHKYQQEIVEKNEGGGEKEHEELKR